MLPLGAGLWGMQPSVSLRGTLASREQETWTVYLETSKAFSQVDLVPAELMKPTVSLTKDPQDPRLKEGSWDL